MLGPKSRLQNTTSTRLNAGCSSSLKKPPTGVAGASARRPAATLRPAPPPPPPPAASQSGRSSLLVNAVDRSASRSSLQSDTTSVCSSLVVVNSAPRVSSSVGRPSASTFKSPVMKRTSSSVTSSSSTCSTSSRSDSLLASKQARPTKASSSATGAQQRLAAPTLAMSLKEKENQIKLLIKERDEQKIQAQMMAQKAEQWEEKFRESELEKSHVTIEADDEVVELRRLSQELEDENKRLSGELQRREQLISDTQFKLDELEIESKELRRSLSEKEELLEEINSRDEAASGDGKSSNEIQTERFVSKLKFEKEIEELKEKVCAREEQIIQLRSSLEMRKNEVTNLQKHAQDLERKFKIESERSERHLKRIDEINLELKASEAKVSTKSEENEHYERNLRQLRQELRSAEEKVEQLSLARKREVESLQSKLSAARRAGSTTPTGGCGSPGAGGQPAFKTPTAQDEILRLQMEIRDLKDQLIDREAELDCSKRDLEIIKRKMETRTLEVDCNNQELARRCQDLLEQNRQSEEQVKLLLLSTSEHSTQLMRATQDLKEANGKCVKLSEEVNELELKLEEQLKKAGQLAKENLQLKGQSEEYREQVESLREQCDSLNGQLGELCEQLNKQTEVLHRDREALAKQLAAREIEQDELKQELATERQNLRSSKLQTQELAGERERLRLDLEMKEKYIQSRNEVVETLRRELEAAKRSLQEHRAKLEELRASVERDSLESINQFELKRAQLLEPLKKDYQAKCEESSALRVRCESLQRKLDENRKQLEEEELEKFDEMRRTHSAELDALKEKLADLERQLAEANSCPPATPEPEGEREEAAEEARRRSQEYETQIEFLNALVVEMQNKCDDYKKRLSQVETKNVLSEFDSLLANKSAGSAPSRASTLKRTSFAPEPPVPNPPTPPSNTLRPLPVATSTLARPSALKKSQQQQAAKGSNAINLDDIKLPARISGRPFCDICQAYDLHHTIYCPKVSEKLATRQQQLELTTDASNNSNNNYLENNNSPDDTTSLANVEELLRDYERSIKHSNAHSEHFKQFNSLRRQVVVEKAPRAYCDHCDLFGHTIKACSSLTRAA